MLSPDRLITITSIVEKICRRVMRGRRSSLVAFGVGGRWEFEIEGLLVGGG